MTLFYSFGIFKLNFCFRNLPVLFVSLISPRAWGRTFLAVIVAGIPLSTSCLDATVSPPASASAVDPCSLPSRAYPSDRRDLQGELERKATGHTGAEEGGEGRSGGVSCEFYWEDCTGCCKFTFGYPVYLGESHLFEKKRHVPRISKNYQ